MKINQHEFKFSPPQVLVIGFAVVILAGALLLSLPAATVEGSSTGFLDALFTSTSAVCVTGLVVVDTGTHFSLLGQITILILIQIGGLGFMTVATLFALLMGKKINLRERLLIKEALNQITMEGVVRLTKYVLILTFSLELAGALILGVRFLHDMEPVQAFYYGLFHSISAFNNAGFDIMGNFNSLTAYSEDVVVNVVITVLFFIGGLGFTVIVDLINHRKWYHFSLHTKLVLSITFILVALGTFTVFVLEYSNEKTIGQLTMSGKLLASYFQGLTPRTAGFNTVNIGDLRDSTQFFIIILMFIGASPGSTGGGIKTATFGTLIMAVRAMIRGNSDVSIFERRLPQSLVNKSLTVVLSALTLIIAVAMLLSITEKAEFLSVLFETTSAFGTVGLSMGLTPSLSPFGRILIILTMFIGRVGPLTLGFALGQRLKKPSYRYAEEKIIVG